MVNRANLQLFPSRLVHHAILFPRSHTHTPVSVTGHTDLFFHRDVRTPLVCVCALQEAVFTKGSRGC